MDVVFHRNCLDGTYSAYLLYLFCKTISKQGYSILCEHLKSHTSNQLQLLCSQKILINQCSSITQQFFHTKSQIPFHSVSMYAGDLFPIFPSTPENISPSTKQIMISMSQRFKYVVIIDHHATFQKCLDFIKQNKLANVYYLWNKQKCASELVEWYLLNSFGFMKNLPSAYQKQLTQQIQYVASNDLKTKQNKKSKQFVLGFYYFQIQLSHHNPLLFKRIWGLNMSTIFSKGQIIYQNHISALIYSVANCEIYQIVKPKFKDVIFLASQMTDRQLVSDLGSILSYLSVKHKFQNLAMIYNKSQGQFRISFRSYQFLDEPKALEISEFYGGGGHLCAAGCFIQKNIFKQHFKYQGKMKPALKITKQEIQNILFNKGGS